MLDVVATILLPVSLDTITFFPLPHMSLTRPSDGLLCADSKRWMVLSSTQAGWLGYATAKGFVRVLAVVEVIHQDVHTCRSIDVS